MSPSQELPLACQRWPNSNLVTISGHSRTGVECSVSAVLRCVPVASSPMLPQGKGEVLVRAGGVGVPRHGGGIYGRAQGQCGDVALVGTRGGAGRSGLFPLPFIFLFSIFC